MSLFLPANVVQSLEEKIVIAMLNDANIIEGVLMRLSAGDFHDDNLRIIFGIIDTLYREGKTIDILTIIDYIRNHKECEFENYEIWLASLTGQFTNSSDIDDHVDLVKNASIKRQMDNFAQVLLDTQLDVNKFNDQIWELEKKFMDIVDSKKSNQVKFLKDITKDYQITLEQIFTNTDEITGITSGYTDIDNLTNGFQPGDLIILAARPGVGKTALGLNFILNAANEINNKKKKDEHHNKDVVVMFSLEMGSNQLCQRMVSSISLTEMSGSRKNVIGEMEWNTMTEAISDISLLPIMIDDSSDLSILDINSKLKQIALNYHIKLVVVDYLQLVRGPKIQGFQSNRQQEVASISRMLKAIARQLNTPIIAIAQLSRKIEERKGDNRRPILSDLRESGAIEQDADLVTFLSYENLATDEDTSVSDPNFVTNPTVEYIIAKHRNGPTGIVKLKFLKNFGRYIHNSADK